VLKHRVLLFSKFGISIGLVTVLLLRADLGMFVAALKEADMLMFGVGLVVVGFNMLVRSYKWQILLKVHGARIPLITVLNLNYMSMFFNNFFLGSIGGDVFRAYRAFGYSNSKGGAVSSVIFDRATGLATELCLILGIGVAFLFAADVLVSIDQIVGLGILCLVASLVAIAVFKFRPLLTSGLVLRKVPKLAKGSEQVMTSIQVYKTHPKTVVSSLALSLLYHLVRSAAVYCFVLAANLDISYMHVLLISLLVGVLIMIPISINGIGIQEGSYVFYLELLGVAGPAALLVAVLSRGSLLAMSLVGGLLFLIDGSGGRSRAPTLFEAEESSRQHLPRRPS
jgi:uncharacterized protein (TIRG00374 family)